MFKLKGEVYLITIKKQFHPIFFVTIFFKSTRCFYQNMLVCSVVIKHLTVPLTYTVLQVLQTNFHTGHAGHVEINRGQ